MLKTVSKQTALVLLLTLFGSLSVSNANTITGSAFTSPKAPSEWGSTIRRNTYLSRGEATDLVVKYFQLEQKNAKFLNECEAVPDECLFAFSAMTNFHGFKPDPAVLYPDVAPVYKYYKAINIATKLDLVRGYYAEEESPYRPLQPINRIEALKLVLGSSGLMNWKEKFELKLMEQKPNWLLAGLNDNAWWYARYIAGAADKGIIASTDKFVPEDAISRKEFLLLMESTNKIVAKGQETSSVDRYGQVYQEANTSGNSQLQAVSGQGQGI